MSRYNFSLANFGGCYVGIEATTLKSACDIYKYVTECLSNPHNRVVDVVEKIDRVVYENAVNKT